MKMKLQFEVIALCLSIFFLSAKWTLAQDASFRDEEDVNSHTPGLHLFEGDIRLTKEQKEALEAAASPRLSQKVVVKSAVRLWPNNRVPYVLDRSLGGSAESAIRDAIDEYHRRTCVRFVPRTSSDSNYVVFVEGRGCSSYIGRLSGAGPQDISIGRGCERKGIVMHEMFHALGRWHEQSRPDRNQYIRVNYDNIVEGTEGNFNIVPSTVATTQGISYDYYSIMHYGAYSFSRNGRPTIEPKDRNVSPDSLGQRDGFSQRDLQHVNELYCDSSASWGPWSSWSSCSRTCGGGTRTRTRSCQGGNSCEGSARATQECNTSPCPGSPTWSSWSEWSSCSATCGGGRRSRTRTCLTGDNCEGKSRQRRDCNTQDCPNSVIAGLRHIGCFKVPSSDKVGLLQSQPFQRNPIRKCARRSIKSQTPYKLFGVSAGYCITGSNKTRHYKLGGRTNFCENGEGAYRTSQDYAMDVYEITNAQRFLSDFIAEDTTIISPNSTQNDTESISVPVPTVIGNIPIVDSSSLVFRPSDLVLLFGLLVAFWCL